MAREIGAALCACNSGGRPLHHRAAARRSPSPLLRNREDDGGRAHLTHPLCERSSWGGGPCSEDCMVEGPVRATRRSMRTAKQQRRNMSPPEVRLWALLRRSAAGVSFRRQHPVGPYVADFYCPAAKLVIEIDGSTHDFTVTRDEKRDDYMRALGLNILRIPASEVMADALSVAD